MTPSEARAAVIAAVEAVAVEQRDRGDRLRAVDRDPAKDRHFALAEQAPPRRPEGRTLSRLWEQEYRLVIAYARTQDALARASADCGLVRDAIEALSWSVAAVREAWVVQGMLDSEDDGAVYADVLFVVVYDRDADYALTADVDLLTADQTVM